MDNEDLSGADNGVLDSLNAAYSELDGGDGGGAPVGNDGAETGEGVIDEGGAGAIEAPGDFSDEEKAIFSALSPEHQKIIAAYANRSHQSRTKTASELDAFKKRLGPVDEAFKQYDGYLKQIGVTPDQAVTQLLPYYARLALGDEQTRKATIEHLAQSYGVNLPAAQQPSSQPDGDEYVDPEIAGLRKQIETLEQKLTGVATSFEDQSRAQQRAQIAAFRSATNADGTPKNPHFEQVQSKMAGMLQSGLATTLDEAYAMAVKLDPEIEAETKRAEDERKRQEAAKAADKAKKAAAVNKKGDPAPATRKAPETLKSLIGDIFDELEGAA